MVQQIELWKARRRGRKQARSDFERDLAQHLHLSVGVPTPRSDRSMEAYIKKGLGYMSFVPGEPVTWAEYAGERQ